MGTAASKAAFKKVQSDGRRLMEERKYSEAISLFQSVLDTHRDKMKEKYITAVNADIAICQAAIASASAASGAAAAASPPGGIAVVVATVPAANANGSAAAAAASPLSPATPNDAKDHKSGDTAAATIAALPPAAAAAGGSPVVAGSGVTTAGTVAVLPVASSSSANTTAGTPATIAALPPVANANSAAAAAVSPPNSGAASAAAAVTPIVSVSANPKNNNSGAAAAAVSAPAVNASSAAAASASVTPSVQPAPVISASQAAAIVANPSAVIQSGVQLLNAGQFAGALATLRSVLAHAAALAAANPGRASILNPTLTALCHFSIGATYDKTGEFGKSIDAYTAAIASGPTAHDRLAYNSRGLAHRALNHHDAAIADLSQALVLNSEDSNVYWNRSLAYLAKGELKNSLDDLEIGMMFEQNPAEVRVFEAQIQSVRQRMANGGGALGAGKPPVSSAANASAAAASAAAAVSSASVNNAAAAVAAGGGGGGSPSIREEANRLQLATALFNQRNHAVALDSFRAMLAALPKPYATPHLEALINLRIGQCLGSLRQSDAAVAAYTVVINLGASPYQQTAYNNRGEQRRSSAHDYPLAIADFTRAIELNNEDATVYWNRALCHEAQQRWEDALSDHELGLAFERDAHERSVFVAQIEMVKQRIRAIAALPPSSKPPTDATAAAAAAASAAGSSAAAPAPNSEEGMIATAMQRFNARQWTQAIEIFRAVQKLNRPLAGGVAREAQCALRIGQCLIELKQFEHAIDSFTECLNITDPSNVYMRLAAYSRASVRQTLKRFDAALVDYARCVQLEPNNAVAYWNRALCHEAKWLATGGSGNATPGTGPGGIMCLVDALRDFERGAAIEPDQKEKAQFATQMNNVRAKIAIIELSHPNASTADHKAEIAAAVAGATASGAAVASVAAGAAAASGAAASSAAGVPAAAVATGDPAKYDPLVTAGTRFQASGHYAEACEKFRAALAMRPFVSRAVECQALCRYGQCLGELQQWGEGIVALTDCLAIPNNAVQHRLAYTYRATAHEKLNRMDDAIADYTLAVASAPGYATNYWNRGLCYENRMQFVEALADHERGLVLEHDQRERAVFQAQIAAVRRKVEEAQAMMHLYAGRAAAGAGGAVDQKSGAAAVAGGGGNRSGAAAGGAAPAVVPVISADEQRVLTKANEYFQRHQFAEAMELYRAVLALPVVANGLSATGEIEALCWFRIAACLARVRRGDSVALIDAYTRCLSISPSQFERIAYNNRGNELREAGYMAEGIVDFTRSIDLGPGTTSTVLDPTDATTYWNRALCWQARLQWDRALQDFEHGHKREKDAGERKLFVDAIAETRQKIALAAAAAASSGAAKPDDDGDDSDTAARQLVGAGQYTEAIAAFTEHFRRHPNHSQSATGYMLLGQCYDSLKEHAKAIDAYTLSLGFDTQLTRAQRSLAYNNRAASRKRAGGQTEAVANDYSLAIQLCPTDATSRWNRAQLYEKQPNRLRAALDDYTAGLELESDEKEKQLFVDAIHKVTTALHAAEADAKTAAAARAAAATGASGAGGSAGGGKDSKSAVDPNSASAVIAAMMEAESSNQDAAVAAELMRQRRFGEAAAAYRRYLTSHPHDRQNPNYFRNLGKCYAELHRYADAADAYTSSITFGGGTAVTAEAMGTAMAVSIAAGSGAGGMADLATFVLSERKGAAQQSQNDVFLSYNNRASNRSRLGLTDAALADYTAAIHCFPENATAYWNRGQLYETKQLYSDALEDYERGMAFEADPNEAALFVAAIDNVKQLRANQKAGKLAPTSATATAAAPGTTTTAAAASGAAGDSKSAPRFAETPTEEALTLLRRATQLFNDQRFADATTAYSAALACNRGAAVNASWLHFQLAVCHAKQSNPVAAIASYTDCLTVLQQQQKQAAMKAAPATATATATVDLTGGCPTRPNPSTVYVNRGFNRSVLKQHAEAVNDFSASIDLEPTANALWNRAQSYEVLGKWGLAIADYEVGLGLEDDLDERKQFQQQINFAKSKLVAAAASPSAVDTKSNTPLSTNSSGSGTPLLFSPIAVAPTPLASASGTVSPQPQPPARSPSAGLEANLPPGPVSGWSVSDVGVWLRSIGSAYHTYAEIFEMHAVNGATLLGLDRALLEELGVDKKIAQLRLWTDIERFRKLEAGASSGAASPPPVASGASAASATAAVPVVNVAVVVSPNQSTAPTATPIASASGGVQSPPANGGAAAAAVSSAAAPPPAQPQRRGGYDERVLLEILNEQTKQMAADAARRVAEEARVSADLARAKSEAARAASEAARLASEEHAARMAEQKQKAEADTASAKAHAASLAAAASAAQQAATEAIERGKADAKAAEEKSKLAAAAAEEARAAAQKMAEQARADAERARIETAEMNRKFADLQRLADEQKRKAEAAIAANAQSAEDRLCAICLDRPKTTLFLPCGHVACCTQCAEALSKCPMCQQPVKQKQKFFL